MKNGGEVLNIKTLVVGPLATNCYIVYDPGSGKACVIDPGADPGRIKDMLRREGLKPMLVINTHGHGDHIAGNKALGLPVYIHRLDGGFLTDPDRNLSRVFMFGITSPAASRLLEEGDVIEIGSGSLEVIHTPGHTPGSISLKCGNAVFTGDALFAGSIGRTDFEYGDESLLIKSIKEKLLKLGDDTAVYPGHGESSTIGDERSSNPFLT
jgi:glyoxylase-like metal-dependent hydrolase (beta-lactamase superfamily II)